MAVTCFPLNGDSLETACGIHHYLRFKMKPKDRKLEECC